MSNRTRVKKLERMATGRAIGAPTPSDPASAREWVALFEDLEPQGLFINEPDFPVALGLLREAAARDDPKYVELEWLLEMYSRVRCGEPPVTESEYASLKEWYFTHESAGSVYDADVRGALINTFSRGPRRLGATRTVAMMRRLRQAHPELP